jgi:hypothetical protein
MVISVRISEEKDSDIYAVLSAMTGTERAEYIRRAIRFYTELGRIDQRLDNIEQMLTGLVQSGTTQHIPAVKPEEISPSKKKILDGINDIFNM